MTDFRICWSIDCESARREIGDLALGRRAIEGFCEILESAGWKGTLFVIPEEVEPLADLLGRAADCGHETALHLHPDESGCESAYLGALSREQQTEAVGLACETFKRALGVLPVSMRPGFGSANDSTFPMLAELGFRQTSASFPGRRMSSLGSNWAGAPLFAHYANPNNRFLEGGLDLVEIPISVDWETMIWGGIHPQDLRVENTDAKNHAYVIRKIINRQLQENLPLKVLVPFTHNIFDYSDPSNFRRQTMECMIGEILRCGEELGLLLQSCTVAEAGAAYRQAMPFSIAERNPGCRPE